YSLQASLPFINILYFLPFMVIILGFFGLGPLTVMVLLGGILESIQLPYPPELIVVAITLGSAISILLSPLIMPIIALSGVNGLSGFKWDPIQLEICPHIVYCWTNLCPRKRFIINFQEKKETTYKSRVTALSHKS